MEGCVWFNLGVTHMKKSISIWSFPGEWALGKKLAVAKEAGFSGFEVDLTEDGPLGLKSTRKDWKEVRALADRHGLELSGLATGLYWGANGASASAATRKRAAAILSKQIEVAAGLGLDAILVVPAAVGVDFIPGAEVVPYDLAIERAEALVRGALPKARKAG